VTSEQVFMNAKECAVRIYQRLWHLRSGKPFLEGGIIPPAELAIIAGEIEKWTFYHEGDPLAELRKLKRLVKEEHRYDYVEHAVQCSCGWKEAPIERKDAWEHWTEHLLESSLAAKDIQ